MKYIAFLLLALTVTPAVAADEPTGPFGLSWGAPISEITNQGVTLSKTDALDRLQIYEAKKLPKNLSIAETYSLIFDAEFGLQKVLMVSDDITSDSTGSEGKSIYATLKQKLTSKYSASTTNMEHVGLELYDEADEFYQCLAYDGCGAWLSVFEEEHSNLGIILELKGLGRGKGYIKLTYEGPQWEKIVANRSAKKEKSDEDAL